MLLLPPGRWPLSPARARRWRPDAWQEARLRHLVELCGLIRVAVGSEAATWLRTSNAVMFGRSPINVLLEEPNGLRGMLFRLRRECRE